MLNAEAIVVGAGPVGCVTALALAQRGARVILLEANTDSARRRLGGEWLHPTAVQVLEKLNVPLDCEVPSGSPGPRTAAGVRGLGFVVFSDPRSEPVALAYESSLKGVACDHGQLVSTLRSAATAHPNVTLLHGRVLHIDGQKAACQFHNAAAKESVRADLIVGADGRASAARRALGLPDNRRTVSHMAGTILEDVDLPKEGYGHVLLGGPGPVFLFRIAPNRVRVTLDVPSAQLARLRDPARLYDAYSKRLPDGLQGAFRKSTGYGRIVWAANQYRPRTSYGRDGLALVGDAVGFFHPLTAVGMTLGFTDGYVLAESESFVEYCRKRSSQTHVADMLAFSLYEVFKAKDASAGALQAAVFRLWRTSERQRARTVQLLSCEETRATQFYNTFLKVTLLAMRGLTADVRFRHWRSIPGLMYGLVAWTIWLVRMCSPLRANRARFLMIQTRP